MIDVAKRYGQAARIGPRRRTGGAAKFRADAAHRHSRSMTMALDERASVCTFDCPDTCSLTVTVEDEHIVKVRGSTAAPYTAGVICSKVAQGMAGFVHGPQRLLTPLRRSGPKGSGQFERVSGAAALGQIHPRGRAGGQRRGAPARVGP